jgi:hypothetical protein
LLSTPKGLLEPFLCKSAKCTKLKAAIKNGRKKCKLKNLFNVALSTVNPPHNQSTIECPTTGTAVTRLVITVAPQKLI